MLIFNQSKYQSNRYSFPTANIDPKEKNKHGYMLKVAEAMYSAFVTDRTAISVDQAYDFQNLRAYGRGQQPSSKYKDAFLNEDNNVPSQIDQNNFKDQKRKAWANVDFENIISYAGKVRDHFHGIFMNQDMDIIGDAIDEDSGMIKQDKKYEIETELLFAKDLAQLREMAGVDAPSLDFFPLDQAELEDYEASGGFKLNFAKAMEKLLKHTFSLSKYEQLKKKWLDDATDLGLIAGKIDENLDTGETIVDYVDPANLIIQWSDYYDFRDSEYCGQVKAKPISEIAHYVEDRDELANIAYMYSGELGNPPKKDWPTYQKMNDYGGYDYDFYKVPVLEGYYIDFEDDYEKEYTDKYGKRKVINTRYGYKKKNNNEKVRKKRTRYLYKFNWVVDSTTLYNYGKAYNQERPDKKDVKLPIRVITVSDNSITRRLRPIYDDMMFSWLKYQNAQIMAANAGYAVDVNLLRNVQLGEKVSDPRELLKMMIETGYLFYSSANDAEGEEYRGGPVQPIQELEGGMRNQLSESVEKFRLALELIENETGLTNLALGGSPQKGESATGQQISTQATQNIIKPIIDGVLDLKGEVGESVMHNLQNRLASEEDLRERYSKVISKKDIQAIVDAQYRGARYGIHFEAKPTQSELEDVYRWIENAMAAGKNGQPLIKVDEGIMLKEQLMNGANLKDVRFKLSYKIRRREIEQQQAAEAAQQKEFKMNMAYKNQEAQREERKLMLEAKKEERLKAMDNKNNLQVKNLEVNNEQKQLAMRLASDENARDHETYLKTVKNE